MATEREEAEHERVLRERGADRVADVHVPLALHVRGDRVRDLRQVGAERDQDDADDEGGRPERGCERACVGDGDVAREQREREPADEETAGERDVHARHRTAPHPVSRLDRR
jgi:hypothetical protein